MSRHVESISARVVGILSLEKSPGWNGLCSDQRNIFCGIPLAPQFIVNKYLLGVVPTSFPSSSDNADTDPTSSDSCSARVYVLENLSHFEENSILCLVKIHKV